jgi:hypothetical protein
MKKSIRTVQESGREACTICVPFDVKREPVYLEWLDDAEEEEDEEDEEEEDEEEDGQDDDQEEDDEDADD